MREIKFRAWAKNSKQIIQDYNGNLNDKDFELMQFTGMVDKSGVEIYEGDLFGEMGGDKERPGEYEVFGEVYFDMDFAGFNVRYPNGGWSTLGEHLLQTKNHREVIGNIYENPELLTTPTKEEKIV